MAEIDLTIAKRERIQKACNHQEADRVPIFVAPGSAVLDYAGVTYWDVEKDQAAYDKMTDKFFGSFDYDLQFHFIGGNPRSHEYLYGRTEFFLADDGVTVQHIQDQNKMHSDEYPRLIENPIKFLKDILIPRKYPEIFSNGLENAVKRVEAVVEEFTESMITGPNGQVNQYIQNKYGALPIADMHHAQPGIDVIFDRFRGFSGTLTDIRRQPQAVLEASEVLYNSPLCDQCKGIKTQAPFGAFLMAHIATYLNPKQFEKFYWPQFKQNILNLNEDGNKFYFLAEGRWLHLVDFLLELPKDSVFVQTDDDDIFEVNKKIGAHQIIGGGLKVEKTKLHTKQECIDYAKKVIDECAPGGGFIFSNDKTLCCVGDINQNLIDTFNFAAEYGKYNK